MRSILAMRSSGVVVVMNASHIKTPEHAVTTMQLVQEAGSVAEVTFRIDADLLREAMAELVAVRAKAPAGKPFAELYNTDTVEPGEEWLGLYNRVREAIMEMGLDLDGGWKKARRDTG